MTIEFVVERAGCASCGELIREAVSDLGHVDSVDVDEQADTALVRLVPSGDVVEEDVQRILDRASVGAGHAYRVRPASWRALAA